MLEVAPDPSLLQGYIERYFAFLGSWCFWALLCWLIPTGFLKNAPAATNPSWRLLSQLLLVPAAILFLLFVQLFKTRTSDLAFYLHLATLTTASIAESSRINQKISQRLLLSFISRGAIAYMSFFLNLQSWYWQPVFLSGGLASMVGAHEIAGYLQKTSKAISSHYRGRKGAQAHQALQRQFGFLGNAYSVFLLLGPLLIAVLSYLNQLPKVYLLLVLTIPLSIKLLKLAKSKEDLEFPPEFFITETTSISIFYAVMMFLVGMFVTF